MPTFSDCHGCSLCLLACPMWLQHRDVTYSPQGFAKALQYDAKAEDIAPQLSACIRCGACDVMCPEDIDLTAMIATLTNTETTMERPDHYATSCQSEVMQQINADDLYIIDAAPFHAHHADRVEHYDRLRQTTGCSINLDLNRMAIPTGVGSLAATLQQFDIQQQISWLIQGQSFNRIVVENPADQNMLAHITGKSVIHVSDLLENTAHA